MIDVKRAGRWPRAHRVQGLLTVLVTLAAGLVVLVGGGPTPLRMNDYEGTGIAQAVWPLGREELLVMPVPAFNQPVRIRGVELRTVYSVGHFYHPDAFYLAFSGDRFYGHFMGKARVIGLQLTEHLGETDISGSTAEPLNSRLVQNLDNHLSLVIPVNIHQPGCHEAQVVFHVTTSDGTAHTLPSRWYVAVDTGVSQSEGDDMCAGPRPAPMATESATPTG